MGGEGRDGGRESPQHEREGLGEAQGQTLGGRRKGEMTTGLQDPEEREAP